MPYDYWNQLPPADGYNLKQHNPTVHKTKQQETILKIVVATFVVVCFITHTTTRLIRNNHNSR